MIMRSLTFITKFILINALCNATVALSYSLFNSSTSVANEFDESRVPLFGPTSDIESILSVLDSGFLSLEANRIYAVNLAVQQNNVDLLVECVSRGVDIKSSLLITGISENPIFTSALQMSLGILKFLLDYGTYHFSTDEELRGKWILIVKMLLKITIIENLEELFEYVFMNAVDVTVELLESSNYIVVCATQYFDQIVKKKEPVDFGMLKRLVKSVQKKFGPSGLLALSLYPNTIEQILVLSNQCSRIVGSPEMHKILSYLLEEGFGHSRSSWTFSVVGFHPSYIPIFESNWININDTGLFGNTPLMFSLQMPNIRRRIPQIEMLIQYSSDLNEINDVGETALSLALKPVFKEEFATPMKYYGELWAQAVVVNRLLSAGASVIIEKKSVQKPVFMELDTLEDIPVSDLVKSDKFLSNLLHNIPDLSANPLLAEVLQLWIHMNQLGHFYPGIASLNIANLLEKFHEFMLWECIFHLKSESNFESPLIPEILYFWNLLQTKVKERNRRRMQRRGFSLLAKFLQEKSKNGELSNFK